MPTLYAKDKATGEFKRVGPVSGSSVDIPTKTSQLENDSGFITSYAVSTHNSDTSAHSDIRAQIETLTNEIVGQDTLLFAKNLSECIDTTKKYVLPDGYIYSYEQVTSYTNLLPKATSEFNGTEIYGEDYNNDGVADGYKTNTRISSSSSGNAVEYSGFCTTGFIQVSHGDVIRVKNITLNKSSVAGYLVNYKDGIYGSVNTLQDESPDENGVYTFEWKHEYSNAFRFSVAVIDETSIITINEEISENDKYDWVKTKYNILDSDCEDRIISLEERIEVLENSSDSGGSSENVSDGIVAYVKEEAERVAKKVYSHQNANTFTFLAISDMHELPSDQQISISNLHAGQGMNLVRKFAHVDFAVCLGDNGWGSSKEASANRATIEMGIDEIQSANAKIDEAFRGIPNFRTPGNHCPLVQNYSFNGNDYLDENDLFPLYGIYNTGSIYPSGEKERGYCYRDFDDYKLRVILMNSSDLKGVTVSDTTSSIRTSVEQLRWFAETIDLSSKPDAGDWGILIFSHLPLDYTTSRHAVAILKAYLNGTSPTLKEDYGIDVEYDYATKNAATIIANIHGHNHCFNVDNLYINSDDDDKISVKRICIPNACFQRTNERGENGELDQGDIEYGELISYEKTANCAEDTAFNVITVDTSAKLIYADNYGAGIDRVIGYGKSTGPTETYPITRNLTNCTTSGSGSHANNLEPFIETITAADGYTMVGATVTITMGGVDVTDDVYADGIIYINSVTGDIVITVVAKEIPTSSTYTNQIPHAEDVDENTVYNDVGYKTGVYLSGGVVTAASGNRANYETTGFIKTNGNSVFYLSGITCPISDGNSRIAFYNSSKEYIQQFGFTQFDTNGYNVPIEYVLDASNNVVKMDFTNLFNASNGAKLKNTAYMRMCASEINNNSVITVNEPIE